MSRLQKSIHEGRYLLARPALMEANTARKPLLDTANNWRSFIRMGDQYLESIQKVIEAAKAASDASDALAARRANADVSGAMRRVVAVTGKAYENFKNGRITLYEVAKLYKLSTKRSSPKYGKSPSPLKMQSDSDLRKALSQSGAGMGKGIREMLDLGARASNEFRMAAQADEDMPPELAAALVNRGLDFRDAVSTNIFARTNSVMRRAAELSKRSWELMMMEDSKLGWDPPWGHDPEIGNVEA
jgi:hypothetical protein